MIDIVKIRRAFNHIIYYDDTHQYYNKNTGEELTSVTTVKKKYINKFEGKTKEYWLNKKAFEAGITPNQMQDEWNEKRIVGNTRGTIIHNYLEQLSKNKVFPFELNIQGLAKLKRQADAFRKDINYFTIDSELIVGNDRFAGQIDWLVVDEDYNIGCIDFKTDKEFKGSYNKKMKPPFNEYPDDTLHQYYWQVNLYKDLFNLCGYNISFIKIAHFGVNNDNYKIYDVPFIDILNKI